MSRYDYIIAVDFEATCWSNQPAEVELRNSEIIEFPAVLFNLKTGQIEAIFHEFIKPTEKPQLSEYCLKLTSISQTMVDNGITLDKALNKFHIWLSKELKSRRLILPKYSKTNFYGNCAFVTWTNYDFGTFLHLECRRKNIKKPQYFNQWIDLSYIFSIRHGCRRYSLPKAFERLGMNFVGKLHLGIDDAKNVAAMTYKLIKMGIRIYMTSDLTPHMMLNENSFL